MSELGEGNNTPQSESENKDKEVKKIKVRLSLFFDGTLNNRVNIDHRIKYEEQKAAGEDGDQIYQKYKGKDNSYEGDYTNVAIMEKLIDESEGYNETLSVYIEGPGTEDDKDDNTMGYAFGADGLIRTTGVRTKVEKGICEAVMKITAKVGDKKRVIELLTIDVFGFSRGAAGARNCIYEVLSSGKKPIKERLIEDEYIVNKVEVSFAGLYDTVSAYGWGVVFDSSDVSTLKLNAVANAKKVLQLAAANEYRKNFSLTDIMSVGKEKGLQVFLPGAHSDVGGGYRAPVNGKLCENGMPIYKSMSLNDVEEEKKRLIEIGWYKESEIAINSYPIYADIIEYVIEVTRANISNEYRKIPFNLMADKAKECGINFKSEIAEETVPGELKSVDGKIRQYVEVVGVQSKTGDWTHNEPWLVKLRHEYLHFSARYEIGHGPRFSDYKRVRKVYRG